MKNKKLFFILLLLCLLLMSCNLLSGISNKIRIYEDGGTAIVELTQMVEMLATETFTTEKTQIALSTQEAIQSATQSYIQQETQVAYSIQATQIASILSFQSYQNTFSSDFENDDLFQEFSDDAGLVESHFRNGGLEMTIHEEDVYFWVYPNAIIPRNVAVEVDAMLVDGDEETGAGVICNYDYDTDQGIYFEITFDGFYVVLKNSHYGWEYVEEFTSTDLVKSDSFNNIKAVCDNGSYEFYVNNNLVTRFNDYDYLGNEVVIYGYTYFEPESVILFDNFYAEGLE